MQERQKQVLESCVRVQTFVQEHPVEGPLSYGSAPATLDAAVRRLREYAGAQVSGRKRSEAELRRQEQMIERLKVQHMRPIVAVARTQIEPESDVRLPSALLMPTGRPRATRMLQACDAMLDAAQQFEAVFVGHGLPGDFLARFRAARDELEGMLGDRTSLLGTRVAAQQGLKEQLRRARRAVERMDAVVKATFVHDEPVLAKWRAARRVQLLPGARGRSAGVDIAPVVPVEMSVAA